MLMKRADLLQNRNNNLLMELPCVLRERMIATARPVNSSLLSERDGGYLASLAHHHTGLW